MYRTGRGSSSSTSRSSRCGSLPALQQIAHRFENLPGHTPARGAEALPPAGAPGTKTCGASRRDTARPRLRRALLLDAGASSSAPASRGWRTRSGPAGSRPTRGRWRAAEPGAKKTLDRPRPGLRDRCGARLALLQTWSSTRRDRPFAATDAALLDVKAWHDRHFASGRTCRRGSGRASSGSGRPASGSPWCRTGNGTLHRLSTGWASPPSRS